MIDKNYVENLTQVVVSKSELLRLMDHYEILKAQVETLKMALDRYHAGPDWEPVSDEYILDKRGMP